MLQPLFLSLLFLSSFLFAEEGPQSRQILYLVQTGHLKQALDLYKQQCQQAGQHNIELLQNIGLMIIDQGWRSSDLETQVMALFGAGISTHDRAMYVLESGLRHPSPQIQLIALNLISKYPHDRADEALNIALSSNELIIRFEALSHLSEKKHPKAFGQIEALMGKVDKKVHCLFPPLFAKLGDPASLAALKRLLSHPDEDVRLAAIISCAKYGRDDLLPQVRILATHHEIPQQEACATALGLLKDGSSIPQLKKLAKSSVPTVRTAALLALYRLGQREAKDSLEALAKTENLFAISSLSDISGSEECLKQLLQSPQINTRINAAIALLKRKDPLSLKHIQQLLINGSSDLSLQKTTSPGKGLTAFKIIPSARQNLESDSLAYEMSLNLKEGLLEFSLELPERDFLALAETLLLCQQNELLPTLVELLCHLQTPEAVALLKKYQQKAGAPLIRNYCNLALCKLKEKRPL